MLVFANMVAQSTVLFLYQIMKSTARETDDHRAIVIEYQEQSLAAAQEVADLVEALAPFMYFKVSLSVSSLRFPLPSFPNTPT